MKNVKKYLPLGLSILLIFSTSIFLAKREKKFDKEDYISLYAGCDSSDNTVTSIFMKDFSKRVFKYTSGKVSIKTFYNGSVGGDLELLEGLLNGNIDFVFQTSAPQVTTIKEAAIFDLPVEYKDINEARRAVDNKILKNLEPFYEKKNLKILAIADQGFRVMTCNKKINSIEDFNKIKIRTMENKNHISFWKEIGANPTPMSYAEVYVGLSQGIIDAQENPLEAIVAPRFYEQQKYLVKTNHLFHPILLTSSKKIFDKLDKTYQEKITNAANDARDYSREILDKRDAKNIRILEKNGMLIQDLNKDTREKLREKSVNTRKKIVDEIDKNLYEKIKEDN